MVDRINLALIGAGYWGSKLAGEYIQLQKSNKKFNFFGIVDPNKARLRDIQNKMNLSSDVLYDNMEQCLLDPEVSAIHIATPNETHYEIAYEGLNHNKHILLEKPMALSSREAFNLVRLAEKRNQVLLVSHIFRFNSALTRAKEILENGLIGNINYLQLSWRDYLNPLPNRDIIFDLFPHPVDIVNYLTDEWPSSIYTTSLSYTKSPDNEINDVAFIIMEMPDKRLVQVTLSWIQPGVKERVVTITGPSGTMMIDTLSQEVTIHRLNDRKNISVDKNNTIKSMITHFLNCVIGVENPNNNSLIGAKNVSVLASAKRSMSEKQAVKVFE
jgi:predicted dehydrogenase